MTSLKDLWSEVAHLEIQTYELLSITFLNNKLSTLNKEHTIRMRGKQRAAIKQVSLSSLCVCEDEMVYYIPIYSRVQYTVLTEHKSYEQMQLNVLYCGSIVIWTNMWEITSCGRERRTKRDRCGCDFRSLVELRTIRNVLFELQWLLIKWSLISDHWSDK